MVLFLCSIFRIFLGTTVENFSIRRSLSETKILDVHLDRSFTTISPHLRIIFAKAWCLS